MEISPFKNLPIKWKLILIILLVSTTVSISQILLFMYYDAVTFKEAKEKRTFAIAEMLGTNSAPALLFDDREDALEILRSLRSIQTVRAAYLFDARGGVLAEYLGEGEKLAIPLDVPHTFQQWMDDKTYTLSYPIVLDKRQLGTLYLESEMSDVVDRQNDIMMLGLISGLVFFLVSLGFAAWLQQVITDPLRQLTRTARQVSETRDYAVRVLLNSRDEFGVLVSSFNQMLSEIQKRDHELGKQMSLLEKTNKELDQFVYVASHDLKAPLRGVENLCRLIEKALREKLAPEHREYLDLLHSRVNRMERLLDDILQYSRVGRISTPTEKVKCKDLVEEVISLLDPPSGFEIKIQEDLPVITTQRTPLEQVFRNLIGNAIKHHVTKEGIIEIKAGYDEDHIKFAVCDDGPGIPDKYQARIFEMFQTLKPRDEVEGSGMGLALVKKIVQDQKGRVWVESKEGHGACFYFTWPRS